MLVTLPFCLRAAYFDVVVYGATPSGIVAAIAAARGGASVALVHPGAHVGGMTASGLGNTDYGHTGAIGGIAREFYARVGAVYGYPIIWTFEPHVAEQVFNAMLSEAAVGLFLQHRLVEKGAVTTTNGRIVSVTTENGDVFSGNVFIDGSYEGDLLARAGVTYTVGRESSQRYGEPDAGVRSDQGLLGFQFPVSAYDSSGSVIGGITAGPSCGARSAPGSADSGLGAYAYRLCLTTSKNKIPFSQPFDYDPTQYDLLKTYLSAFSKAFGRAPRMSDLFNIAPLTPTSAAKADFNNKGPISTDMVGASAEYPEATYSRREEIQAAHARYTKGLFYFLFSDISVPASLRTEVSGWGLASDEFTDNSYWPFQLYIREGRRMIGSYVLTEADVRQAVTKPDSIGLGSYEADSHVVQRCIDKLGNASNEGNIDIPVLPYQIPYGVIIPKHNEVRNLLVTFAVSASHVAFSTLRMEPVGMILGQAAGQAAVIAIQQSVDIQDVSTVDLQNALVNSGAILSWNITPSMISGFGGSAPVTPGGLFTITGTNLADYRTDVYTPLFKSPLGTASVSIDRFKAMLSHSDPLTISGQIPWELVPGTYNLIVNINDLPSPATTVNLVAAAPVILTELGAPAIHNADGSVNTANNPAAPGSVLTLRATGLGPVTNQPPDGLPGSTDLLSLPTLDVVARVDDGTAQLLDASLASDGVGVFVVRVNVPQLSPGSHSISLSVASFSSNRAAFWIGGPNQSLPSTKSGIPGLAEADGVLQIAYLAHLDKGDSYITFINSGAVSGFDPVGRLCANVYTFNPAAELISCCACMLTPNGLSSLSALRDLVSNTFTPGSPSSIAVKVLSSKPNLGGVCDPSVSNLASGGLARGVRAWVTTLHPSPSSPLTFRTLEFSFSKAELSKSEESLLVSQCRFIQANGSGFGVCRSCRPGLDYAN